MCIRDRYDIETQEELAEKVNESGFQVTQATVSREIRELKLTKISKPGGEMCIRDSFSAAVYDRI